ncbi:MAG: protein translocase subunit SecD [Dehalococcoidia bacterium]|nr:protein translocase subunit SecD [Dehalococcoidia bacterium]
MPRKRIVLPSFIVVLVSFALWVVWPQNPSTYLPSFIPWPERGWIELNVGDFSFVRKGMSLGLDLQGGVNLIIEADVTQRPPGERSEAMKGVQQIIERRINAFGVSEPVIQSVGGNRLSIQLPGVTDVEDAKSLIGRTAKLDFREQELDATGVAKRDENGQVIWKPSTGILNGEQREITGSYLQNAAIVPSPQTNLPEVSFQFNSDGAELFGQATTRLVGRPLGIFLDNELISAPSVRAVIRTSGVITGLTQQEATNLTIQLNAGALPVPISIVKEQTVDATLGQDSIRKSILAGEIGLGVVLLFMVFYYRLTGLMAGLALLMYTTLLLATFKIIPVTLTLAGIAAFILSIGMAVDANILIFERMKEELRLGRTFGAAIEAGFGRAWPSIRDSNVSTLITCAILFWFGRQFGASLVMGFALTLAIGVMMSMFSAITITRTLLRILVGRFRGRNNWLFGAI